MKKLGFKDIAELLAAKLHMFGYKLTNADQRRDDRSGLIRLEDDLDVKDALIISITYFPSTQEYEILSVRLENNERNSLGLAVGGTIYEVEKFIEDHNHFCRVLEDYKGQSKSED